MHFAFAFGDGGTVGWFETAVYFPSNDALSAFISGAENEMFFVFFPIFGRIGAFQQCQLFKKTL